MSQIPYVVNTLKLYLKTKGMTYKKLAVELGLSEVTVKRMFAQNKFSLDRIEEICRIIELDFFDLVLMAKKENENKSHTLSLEQESALADDPRLFAYFILLLNGWLPPAIVKNYEFSDLESDKMLLALDRLRLIELFPEKRFRLLVANNVHWQKKGPIWRQYQQEFFDGMAAYPFDTSKDRIVFNPAHLSPTSIKSILAKIDSLARHFRELAELDSSLPIENRTSVAMVLGFRPWISSNIQNLIKTPSK